MSAWYNENDPNAAAWLRELIRRGHIAPGDVDERSIEDVRPNELAEYRQCHFFAGIGVWSFALRQAGWADDRPVWTGSCPCQPFSAAGKGGGFADERHLWPAWFHLISQRCPERIYGEQVASKDGLAWLDLVHSDLEAAGYTFGANDLCAAGFGAPHLRQRLWFVADAQRSGPQRWRGAECEEQQSNGQAGPLRAVDQLADAGRERRRQKCANLIWRPEGSGETRVEQRPELRGAVNGFWAGAEYVDCRDGKRRAIEPGSKPLVDGPEERMVRLRGYGNAIVAPVASAFIKASMEALDAAA